jgi:hypothetical protein
MVVIEQVEIISIQHIVMGANAELLTPSDQRRDSSGATPAIWLNARTGARQ